MHMMPNTHVPGTELSPLAVGLVRGRLWLYLALTLLAVTVIAAERMARLPEGRPAPPAATANHAAPAPPQDDRPPLLPDR